MTTSEKIIIQTLCYSDIFDFPLTSDEINKFEIRSPKIKSISNSKSKIRNSMVIGKRGSYYFLKGREKLVGMRKKREGYSKQKQLYTEKYGHYFKLIPSIQLVAITGAVAADNAKEDDDIDILIITKTGWLWTTRFFAVLLTELLGLRRKPNDINLNNKLCLNMFIDEDHMQVPKEEQDIFSANEIVRMKVLWGREDIVSKFYIENNWVKNFLPNSMARLDKFKSPKSIITQSGPLPIIEKLFKNIQLAYMESRRTSEVIKDGYIRFHPKDARKWILLEYKKRMKKYGLL